MWAGNSTKDGILINGQRVVLRYRLDLDTDESEQDTKLITKRFPLRKRRLSWVSTR